jgi:hypothetical protein
MPLRSYTQAELVLTERRRVEHPLLLLVWLSVGAFTMADAAWFYLGLGSLAIVIHLGAVHRAKELYVDRWIVNVSVLAATGVVGTEYLFVERSNLLTVLGHYLILIEVCKLFERKTNRDYVQMLALSMLLIVAGALRCEDLWYGFAMLAYLLLACYTAMVFTLKRGLDAVASARLPGESVPLSPHRVAWNVIRDWPGRVIGRRVLTSVAVILIAAVAIFLMVPRGLAQRGTPANAYGFSPHVQLGERKQLHLSDSIQMRVVVRSDPNRGLPVSLTYLRGRVFNTYRASRWWAQAEGEPLVREDPVRPTADPPEQSVALDVYDMSPGLLPYLFTPYPVVEVKTSVGSARIGPYREVTLQAPPKLRGRVTYTAYCLPQPLTEKLLNDLRATGSRPAQNLGDPRTGVDVTWSVAKLAQDWCADLLTKRERARDRGSGKLLEDCDLAIANRILVRLQDHCSYTLDLSGVDPARDAVEDFLFYTRRGHCEYFATAMAVMCRSLGIHARLVTGFQMSEYDDSRGCYVVRQRDAHAWVEVYTPGTDWCTMDPTPPGSHSMVSAEPTPPEMGWWDRLEDFWQARVLGYNATSRHELGERIRAFLAGVWKDIGDAMTTLKESFMGLLLRGEVDRILARFLTVIAAAWFVVFGIVVFRVVRRRLRARQAATRNPAMLPANVAFLRRLLELLRRRGLTVRPGQTLLELAAEAAGRLNADPRLLDDLVVLYYRMRWGGVAPRPEELTGASAKVDLLAQGLGR